MESHTQFHDGRFEGFRIDGSTIQLFLTTDAGQGSTLIALGVAAFSAGGFRSGNIIFDIKIRDSHELEIADVKALYELREDSESEATQLLARAQEGALKVAEISSSYGGTCIVLAKSVKFTEGGSARDGS